MYYHCIEREYIVAAALYVLLFQTESYENVGSLSSNIITYPDNNRVILQATDGN